MNELVITTPDGGARSIALLGQVLVLGRSGGGDLAFPDDSGLSRQHLAIEQGPVGWVVRDLGSKNGTYVNGERVSGSRLLHPGDRITASRVQLLFRAGETPLHTVIFDPAAVAASTRGAISTSLPQVLARAQAAPAGPASRANWTSPVSALVRAGRELALRRPLAELFPVLLSLAIEAVDAERGVLLTLEDGNLVAQASSGGEFRISSMVRDRVLQERSSLLIGNVLEDEQLQNRQSIVLQGVLSLMVAPLQTDDRVIGLLYVDSSRFARSFGEDDLNLLTVMANIAAIRIDRERLAAVEEAELRHQAELSQAAEIQSRHLPADPPRWPSLELAGRNTACRTVGGDYFDYLTLPDGRTALIIADVAGKGLPAALLMMALQARVQALADSVSSLAEFVTRLNRSLAVSCPSNRFITLFALAIDPATGAFSYVNAGHNPTLLLHADGRTELLEEGGPVLGLLPGLSYTEASGTLTPGELLLFYTDGVSEAESPAGEEFDVPRLSRLLLRLRNQPVAAIVDAVEQAVEEWTAAAPPADDRTLIVARRL